MGLQKSRQTLAVSSATLEKSLSLYVQIEWGYRKYYVCKRGKILQVNADSFRRLAHQVQAIQKPQTPDPGWKPMWLWLLSYRVQTQYDVRLDESNLSSFAYVESNSCTVHNGKWMDLMYQCGAAFSHSLDSSTLTSHPTSATLTPRWFGMGSRTTSCLWSTKGHLSEHAREGSAGSRCPTAHPTHCVDSATRVWARLEMLWENNIILGRIF